MKPTMMIPLALVGLLAAACSHDATPAQTPSTTTNTTTTTAAFNPPPADNMAQPTLANQPANTNQDIQSGSVANTGVGDNGLNSNSSDTTNSGSMGSQPSTSYGPQTQSKFTTGTAALNDQHANTKPQPATSGTSAKSAKSATDQGQSNSEVKITARIRKTMMVSKSLSFGAKNAKIITQGDKVTLIGNVKSDAEKNEIEGIAKSTDGVSTVDDQLVVKQ